MYDTLSSVALTVQAVRLSAALCLDYKLHDRQQWAQLLQQMITLHMVSGCRSGIKCFSYTHKRLRKNTFNVTKQKRTQFCHKCLCPCSDQMAMTHKNSEKVEAAYVLVLTV